MRYIHSEERLPIPDNGEHLEKKKKELESHPVFGLLPPGWLQGGGGYGCMEGG